MWFNGTNWDYLGLPGFSEGGASYVNIAFSPDGVPYVAFQDWTQADKVTVMKFDGTEWVNVGVPGFSTDIASYLSLAITPDGIPCVGYADKGNSWKGTVMKFDGTQWVNLGSPGFTDGDASYTCLTFDGSGVPYLAYSDDAVDYKSSVMKFDGTNWVYVGTQGFSAGVASRLSMAISPQGQPYLSYIDGQHGDCASVMMFNGIQWVNVGPAGFTGHSITCTSLAFGPEGEPYIGMEEYILKVINYRANVMKFTGTNWVNVGNLGFSVERIDCPSLAFDPTGNPCLGYVDYGNSAKATVMTYGSVSVGLNDLTNQEVCLYPNPAISNLTIDLKTAPNAAVTYEITDVTGKLLAMSRTTTHPVSIDVTDFSSGVYFIRIKTESSFFVRKFGKK
jgi:hypothetical protein